MSDEMLKDASYVKISSYRLRVVEVLDRNGSVMMPMEIARESGILPNHISKVLRELKDKGILECLNEDARKGRLYRLTGYGWGVVGLLKSVF